MIRLVEIVPNDTYGRPRGRWFLCWADERWVWTYNAVAHFKAARYHSPMVSSRIPHKMCCHSLSPSGARSLPQLCLCCSDVQFVSVHVLYRMKVIDTGVMIYEGKSIWADFQIFSFCLFLCVFSFCVCLLPIIYSNRLFQVPTSY